MWFDLPINGLSEGDFMSPPDRGRPGPKFDLASRGEGGAQHDNPVVADRVTSPVAAGARDRKVVFPDRHDDDAATQKAHMNRLSRDTKFLLVMAITRNGYWRIGLQTGEDHGMPLYTGISFSREWKALAIGEQSSAEELVRAAQQEKDGRQRTQIPVITAATAEELRTKYKAELAVKEATAEEVEKMLATQDELRPRDKDDEIAELKRTNDDLAARLMRLELAATGNAAKDASKTPRVSDKSSSPRGGDQP